MRSIVESGLSMANAYVRGQYPVSRCLWFRVREPFGIFATEVFDISSTTATSLCEVFMMRSAICLRRSSNQSLRSGSLTVHGYRSIGIHKNNRSVQSYVLPLNARSAETVLHDCNTVKQQCWSWTSTTFVPRTTPQNHNPRRSCLGCSLLELVVVLLLVRWILVGFAALSFHTNIQFESSYVDLKGRCDPFPELFLHSSLLQSGASGGS